MTTSLRFRIRIARAEAKLSRSVLARRVGVSASAPRLPGSAMFVADSVTYFSASGRRLRSSSLPWERMTTFLKPRVCAVLG